MTLPNQAAVGRSEPIFAAPRHQAAAASSQKLNASPSKLITFGFWLFTALFCLQIGFTAYAQLALPQVAQMFEHLGFPAYFRVELSWAKLVGILVLLAPVSNRLKEWAYAGFAITLGSALVAHFSLGDGPAVWGWAAGTSVLLALSYSFWVRRHSGGGEVAADLRGEGR
jgi:hypothetical protein